MKAVGVFAINRRFKALERPLRSAALKIMKLMRLNGSEFTVFLVNERFMNKNVLAFPAPKNFPNPESRLKQLGEIFLNPDYIKKERLPPRLAGRASLLWGGKIPVKLVYMLAHGFLHLLGYDHEDRRDRIRMERKERELLSKL